nr:hypothetical protein CFP56_52579 [Quercus suber]
MRLDSHQRKTQDTFFALSTAPMTTPISVHAGCDVFGRAGYQRPRRSVVVASFNIPTSLEPPSLTASYSSLVQSSIPKSAGYTVFTWYRLTDIKDPPMDQQDAEHTQLLTIANQNLPLQESFHRPKDTKWKVHPSLARRRRRIGMSTSPIGTLRIVSLRAEITPCNADLCHTLVLKLSETTRSYCGPGPLTLSFQSQHGARNIPFRSHNQDKTVREETYIPSAAKVASRADNCDTLLQTGMRIGGRWRRLVNMSIHYQDIQSISGHHQVSRSDVSFMVPDCLSRNLQAGTDPCLLTSPEATQGSEANLQPILQELTNL